MKKCLKRVMALFMTSSLLLSGCGAAESADDRKQETEGTETVELTVWGEKDNTATLTKNSIRDRRILISHLKHRRIQG